MADPEKVEQLRQLTIQERPQVIGSADRLNAMFSQGAFAWNQDLLPLLRRLPRPICLDVDGTLLGSEVGDTSTYLRGDIDYTELIQRVTPNPEAIESLERLRAVGTVVLTTGRNWDSWEQRRGMLENFGLWHEGMVMMDGNNLRYVDSSMTHEEIFSKKDAREKEMKDWARATGFVDEHLERSKPKFRDWLKSKDWDFQFLAFSIPLVDSYKSLAPAFRKSYDIPLIDDTPHHIRLINYPPIPGMLGILVHRFYPDKGYHILDRDPYKSITLPQATDRVTEHYAALI